MKAISLLQPWATLVVIGAKKIETRSWNTKFRGEILIHASAKMTNEQKSLTQLKPFWSALKNLDELPLGSIIGKVVITATCTTEFIQSCVDGRIALKHKYSSKAWKQELAFGDYSANRFAWLMEKPVAFKYPTKIKGARSLWDCDFRICKECGCTDNDCRQCIEKTGQPCYWVEQHLCSACSR